MPREDARPCASGTLVSGRYSLAFGGETYGYVVHAPPGHDGSRRLPLVLSWHSFTGTAEKQEAATGMDAIADRDGFLVVYPDSPDDAWNGGTCCAYKNLERDDVGFARALVAELQRAACVDPRRIYSTGMSNGGFMSYRLACEASDLFAAVAPVSAKVGIPDCAPARPVPVLHFHGTEDSIVPYSSDYLSAEGLTVPEMLGRWADRDGCTGTPGVEYTRGRVTCVEWRPCAGGASVQLCTDEGGDHCWPGSPTCPFPNPTTDIDANQYMADFFARFTLP